MPLHLPYNRSVTLNAKRLRAEMTEEESKLWYQYLRSYPIRFGRQKVIGNCIVDFYCSKCRLGIEVDGSQHFKANGIAHDEARTHLLNAYGVTIIRFHNEQVRSDFASVCRTIDDRVKELAGADEQSKLG